MFTRRSRYYRLPDAYAIDRNGRRYASKSLRIKGELGAKFMHTLESSDRLDHLAYKYYKQSLHWWRICDGNNIKSPRELIDKSPIKSIRVSLRWIGSVVPWADLFSMLNETNGVESVSKGSEDNIVPEKMFYIDSVMFAIDVGLFSELEPSTLLQALTAPLVAELSLNGLTLSGDVKLYMEGERLYRLHELETGDVYYVRLIVADPPDSDTLEVLSGISQTDWLLEIAYNEQVISYEEISDQIEALGFTVEQLDKVGRIGKTVLIPPRFIG